MLAVTGSALVHAALVLSFSPALTEPALAAPSEPHQGVWPSPFAFRTEDPLAHQAPGPPLPALQACFDRETLEDLAYRLSPAGAYGYRAEQASSWSEMEPLVRFEQFYPEGSGELDEKASGDMFRSSLVACVQAAKGYEWRGTGRVNIRVLRRADGRARAQAWPLDAETSDPQLTCCLRESQELLAARVPPGKEAHYVMRFSDGRIELSPNPLPRPLEEYDVWACGGFACDF